MLGDWYALDVVIDHQQYILCVSENGRLPVVVKAAPYATFPERLLSSLGDFLQRIGVSDEKARDEISKMEEIVLAKTNSRSVLGSMNEFRHMLHAQSQAVRFKHDALRMSFDLANMISLILPDYTPKDAVLKFFEQPVDSVA